MQCKLFFAGNEISQILFSIILSYYGGQGHRPRWISAGVLFSAASCFFLASPHFFYGPGSDALSLTEEYGYLFDAPGKNPKSVISSMLNKTSSKFHLLKPYLISKHTPCNIN